LSENALLHKGIDGDGELGSVSLGLGGKGADIGREGKAASREIDEHEIGSVGKSIEIGCEGHVWTEIDWSDSRKRVILG
jgi:hypothetical protein